MKKQFTFLFVLFVLVLCCAIPFIVNAVDSNVISTDLPLFDVGSLSFVQGFEERNVQPNTIYKFTISLLNRILLGNDTSREVSIVATKARLPNTFSIEGAIVCPTGWPAGHFEDNSEGTSVVCTEPGLDTSVSNPTSNPEYDLTYGQNGNMSFTFTTPSSAGTTDLVIYVSYINSDGLIQTIVWPTALHIIVESSICTSWTYTDWNACTITGEQTRTILSYLPSGCVGGSPENRKSCTFSLIPTIKSIDGNTDIIHPGDVITVDGTNFTSSQQNFSCSNCKILINDKELAHSNWVGTDWVSLIIPEDAISGYIQIRNQYGQISEKFPLIITPSPCILISYSGWSQCGPDGTQTRSITSKYPSICEGGKLPETTRSCIYVPACTSDMWSCASWGSCLSNNTQIRTCSKVSNCQGGVASPITTQSCVYTPSCKADTWTCGSWSSCSASGIQSRSCTKTFDCSSVQTASPITDQYCEAPNRTQQASPSESDEILNQDTIIKSTVKLECPVDDYKASQGSGTVIDSSGTILTNKHVIAGTLGCWVGFIDSFNDEPYFGDRQIADITKISSTQDVAILKIRNPKNVRLSYVDITKGSVNFSLGTKITTYGYPAKFGTKITYTSGDFSGSDGNYLKTTAILEYGNSGGGAYLKNGTFIGIPSAVVKGELNAMGYLLSIDVIKAWISNSIITSGNTNNNYSRVSVLEDMDLNKLDSLKLFIPDVDEIGNLSVSTENENSQEVAEQSQSSQIQKESTIIESTSSNQETNSGQGKGSNFNIKISDQRKSMVANAIQEIINVAEHNSEIGQEIKTIAQTQIQNQEKLETGIQKIQSRSGFTKFFIGPNYSEIKNSQKLLDQVKEQIQKLNEIRTQIVNQGDQLQIIEQIQALEQVGQQTETLLNETQKGFSLFGWVFRLFNQ